MRIIIRLLVLTVLILWIFKLFGNTDIASEVFKKTVAYYPVADKTENIVINSNKTFFKLNVPYVSEAPEGDWSGNWVNACEEATITMVEYYYKGYQNVSVNEAKTSLQKLFDEEDNRYGNNKNADASQMHEMISAFESFESIIVENPTIDQIKNELLNGRPVISLHRGFTLNNPNIPFSPTKSSYHTVVVVGFDDVSQEFITHDPGDDVDGVNHRYSYESFMSSLHNYNKYTDTTDGVPTAIFTNKK